MRRKDQSGRRQQITRAARQVVLDRGAVGVRITDIAARAGLAPSSVLYYYPRLDELLLEVSRDAFGRYGEDRARRVAAVDDPRLALRTAIALGVPTGPEDEGSRLLYELDAFTGASPAFAVVTTAYFDRQASVYRSILDAGEAGGQFELASAAERIARGLVALEDGLGLQVVIAHPGIDAGEAERILLDYASTMTGCELGEVALSGDAQEVS